ncbi:MAG: acyltransferase [Propionivibrio sp.]|nr:acyltransferase [Propionivibrio sp.]
MTLQPELRIGDGCYIGRFGTLACINRVILGRDVMISDRVFIGDAVHGFARSDLPVRDQYLTSKGSVEIGDGTWIGIGVSILPNVAIGRNCVIGANSVVTRDVPDFCVVAGNPAKVIRSIAESS